MGFKMAGWSAFTKNGDDDKKTKPKGRLVSKVTKKLKTGLRKLTDKKNIKDPELTKKQYELDEAPFGKDE